MGSSFYRVGVTGPSDYTGGYGSQGDYHIDTKFAQSLPLAQRVQLFTDLAQKAAAEGRRFEFSNQGVAGLVFDPNASLEDRTALYQKAVGAHAPRSGFDSIDYYSVAGKDNRFGKSAEGAPIYMPNVAGGKITASSGGGYGNFAYVTGPKGNVLVKTGHADTRFKGGQIPQPTETVLAAKPQDQPSVVSQPVSDTPTPEPTPTTPAPTSATPEPTPSDEIISDKDFFRDKMKNVMLEKLFKDEYEPKVSTSTAREEIAADLRNRPRRFAQQVDLTPIVANFEVPKINSSDNAFKQISAAASEI